MSIGIVCPKCGRRVQAKVELAGKRVKCPACFAVLTLPREPVPEDAAPNDAVRGRKQQDPEPSPELRRLFDHHAALGMQKQMFMNEFLEGENSTWHLALDKGTITFSFRDRDEQHTFPIQLLGTFIADAKPTFRWAWGDQSNQFPESILKAAHKLREYGEQKQIPEFTASDFALRAPVKDPQWGWYNVHYLGMIAAGLCHATFYYRAPWKPEHLSLLVLVMPPKGTELPHLDSSGVADLLQQLVTSFNTSGFNHQQVVRSYVKQTGWEIAEETEAKWTIRHPSGDEFEVFYDADGDLDSVTPQASDNAEDEEPEVEVEEDGSGETYALADTNGADGKEASRASFEQGAAHLQSEASEQALDRLTEGAWHLRQGMFREEEGEAEQAVEEFTRAIAWFRKVLALLEKHETAQAIAQFSEAVDLNDFLSSSHTGRANAFLALDQLEEAARDYTEALRYEPGNAQLHLGRGRALGQMGDDERAIADFTKAIKLDPQLSEAWCNRGAAHGNLDNDKQALADFTKAIELAPEEPIGYLYRGRFYQFQDDYDRAIRDLSKAIELEPGLVDAYAERAAAYANKGAFAKALADYREAIRLKPDDPYRNSELAWFLATCPKDELRDGAKAVKYATKACKLTEGKHSQHMATLAAAYAETGEFDKAVKYVKAALQVPELDEEFVQELREQLGLYEKRKPYRHE